MTLRCWFAPHDFIRARNDRLEAILRCSVCGTVRPLLQSAVLTGPKHRPDRVLGEPQQWAVPEKVTKITRRA